MHQATFASVAVEQYRCRTTVVCRQKSHLAYPVRICVRDDRGVTFFFTSVIISLRFYEGNSPINVACDERNLIRMLWEQTSLDVTINDPLGR